jgi:LPS export ABC transporter protein LptC
MKIGSYISLFILAALMIVSCENKGDFIPKAEILTYPSVSVKDFQTVYDDSGKIELIMKAPLMEDYTEKDSPYTEFRQGIKVDYYDKKPTLQGSVTSKYAKFTKNDNLWELRDSVVVINENNDKLETELLYWDQKKDLIYTDRFVEISTSDLVMQGFGFESDSHLNHRVIKKVTAELYYEEE